MLSSGGVANSPELRRRPGVRGALAVVVASLALLLPVRGHAGADQAAAGRRELVVFAAASLRETFDALARTFEAANPGVQVRLNLAGSQELRVQLEQGARADVFAGADLVQARALFSAGLIESPRVFARNLPVVVVPRANPAGVRSFADLPRARRLVIGGPDVPIGRYTLGILERARKVHGAAFVQALGKNVASRELNVRQVLAKVTLGEADAGIVYRSDALAARDAVTIIEIPTALNQAAEYPIATVKAAPQPALAAAWCALVLSPTGRDALKRSGFLPDELAATAPPAPAPGPRP